MSSLAHFHDLIFMLDSLAQYLFIPGLISDRAIKSKLSTCADGGATFLGSKDFPPSLVDACRKFDPKGILFGDDTIPPPSVSAPEGPAAIRVKELLHDRLCGKKLLLCSGGDDKLVPYERGQAFLDWLKESTSSWLKADNISVDDRIYPGVGHLFSPDMVVDAVRFITSAVDVADESQNVVDRLLESKI